MGHCKEIANNHGQSDIQNPKRIHLWLTNKQLYKAHISHIEYTGSPKDLLRLIYLEKVFDFVPWKFYMMVFKFLASVKNLSNGLSFSMTILNHMFLNVEFYQQKFLLAWYADKVTQFHHPSPGDLEHEN